MFTNHIFLTIYSWFLSATLYLLHWCICACMHMDLLISQFLLILTYTEGSCWLLLMRQLTNLNMVQLFKMEDVSMGMWVEQFNSTRAVVEYVHNLRFCQFGCIEEYYTAHYQSPRQMTCMWEKLQHQGKPLCCNMRWQMW